MRFRYSWFVPMVETYSKPDSMSWMASCSLWATLHIYSSFVQLDSISSMCMYVSVERIVLCPRICLTCHASWVLCCSVVAFQCLNVCRWIWLSRGLPSFNAVFFRRLSKLTLIDFELVWNTLSDVFGSLLSMDKRVSLIGKMRSLLSFSAWM